MQNKFNYVKRGYDPEEVDNYIETLESVLRSYKEKDSAIKNAIISAQIAADNIVKNAEIQANEIKNRALSQITNFTETIDQQKILVKQFQEDYNYLVQKYVHDFNEGEFRELYSRLSTLEDYLDKLEAPIYYMPENYELPILVENNDHLK